MFINKCLQTTTEMETEVLFTLISDTLNNCIYLQKTKTNYLNEKKSQLLGIVQHVH